MKSLVILTTFFLFLMSSFVQAQVFPEVEYEELEYELSWGLFTVGYATFSAQHQADGKWELQMRVRSTDWADTFYSVNTHMRSQVSDTWQEILAHSKRQQEGSTDRDIEFLLNKDAQTITYTDFGRKEEAITWVDGVLDPLSVLYKARHDFLYQQAIDSLMVTDGKRTFEMPFEITERSKRVSTPYGKYDTVEVSPSTKDMGGVFKKSKKSRLKVYLDKETGVPVMLKSEVAVGSFKAKLIRMETR